MILVRFFDFFLILVIFGHFGPLGGPLGAWCYSWGPPRTSIRSLTSLTTLPPSLISRPVQFSDFVEFWGLPTDQVYAYCITKMITMGVIDWDLVMLIIGSVAQQVAYQRQPLWTSMDFKAWTHRWSFKKSACDPQFSRNWLFPPLIWDQSWLFDHLHELIKWKAKMLNRGK